MWGGTLNQQTLNDASRLEMCQVRFLHWHTWLSPHSTEASDLFQLGFVLDQFRSFVNKNVKISLKKKETNKNQICFNTNQHQ